MLFYNKHVHLQQRTKQCEDFQRDFPPSQLPGYFVNSAFSAIPVFGESWRAALLVRRIRSAVYIVRHQRLVIQNSMTFARKRTTSTLAPTSSTELQTRREKAQKAIISGAATANRS